MCGIVGIISKSKPGFYQGDLNTFKNLLVIDSLRGEDSTGVFGIHKNLQAKTIKVAAEPHMLFRTDEWRTFEPKAIATMRILVGHNRYATKGAINNRNAHPFSVGKIILVHNGTINNQKDFNKDVEVDSHAIAHALNERPAKEVLSEIDGAFALVWYNREDGKVYIARNSQRPLHYINTSTNLYFGSEATMLEYVMNRNNSAVDHKAYSFPVGKLISYDTKGVTTSEDFDLYSPKYTGGYTPTTYTPKVTYPTTGTPSNPFKAYEKGAQLPFKTQLLLSISAISQEQNGTIRCTGKIVHPVPNQDFSGRFKEGITMTDAMNMVGQDIFAEGLSSGSINTVCGTSYYVLDVQPTETLPVYNKTKLPRALWNHICANHKCDKCGCDIYTQEADMTSVKIKNLSYTLRVVCEDCVIGALDEKTRPSNIESSNSAVQTVEQISQQLEEWVNSNPSEEGIIH